MTCRLELQLFATCTYQEKQMLVFWKILRLYEMNDTYKCGNSAREFTSFSGDFHEQLVDPMASPMCL